jgi:hypothetical protein
MGLRDVLNDSRGGVEADVDEGRELLAQHGLDAAVQLRQDLRPEPFEEAIDGLAQVPAAVGEQPPVCRRLRPGFGPFPGRLFQQLGAVAPVAGGLEVAEDELDGLVQAAGGLALPDLAEAAADAFDEPVARGRLGSGFEDDRHTASRRGGVPPAAGSPRAAVARRRTDARPGSRARQTTIAFFFPPGLGVRAGGGTW